MADRNLSDKKLQVVNPAKDPREIKINERKSVDNFESVTINEAEPEKIVEIPLKYSSVKEKIEIVGSIDKTIPKIELSDKDKKLLRKLELEYEKKITDVTNNTLEYSKSDESSKSSQFNSIEPKIKPVIKPRITVSFI